ncbi:hypothetical protein PV327_004554 [Microctonus hyperodae]|uniref:sn-1-specific diacylglycerol lipase n=1 Tax=Microctonus hyperodae TaxID=165561 RepID=A0AA39KMS8_MICHY|nr:hypothetical protein PV327_004554 [Microctonus hyperodae]
MPGIVAFGRRWRAGSDDLIIPGFFLSLTHFIQVIVLGVFLGLITWDRSVTCALLLWSYILGYLIILIVSMVVEVGICILATRGSILDTNARAPMHHLLYMKLSLLLIETGWLCAGVTWLIYYYKSCSAVDQAKDVMLGLVICNWCILMSVTVTVWCTYDAAGRSWVKMKKYQRSMREAESRGGGRMHYKRSGSRNRNWRQRKVIRAYQDSWDNRCRLLFCCIGNSDRNRNSFTDIARLLSDFFRDLDVVPSDVVAGLVLLRKFQKIERELIVKQRKNDTYEFLSGVPITPRTKFLSLTEDGDLAHFQAVIHYMHFALAAYGWPLFLINHTTGLCQLCTRLRCGCFPCIKYDDDATVVEDNCCQCNYAALRRMIDVGEVEVVYATFHVDVGETPFFVALDYTRKKNPTRGTDQFGLTLVGHSLGAGTASILAILLRQEYPDLVCFSYAPPGGLLSMPAQQYTQEFITSTVVGKDVVPRIGLRQMESLRADLINAIKRSVDPKWKTIACSVMCCGCGSTPTSAANLEAGGCIAEYQRDKDQARAQTIVPSDSSIALTLHTPLYPPGKIIHVVRHHSNKGEQVLRKREPVYQALWAEPSDFDEVLISPVMIQDHMPDSMLKALNKVSKQLVEKTEIGEVRNRHIAASRCSSIRLGDYEPLEEITDIQEIMNPNDIVSFQSSLMNRNVQSINCSNDAINPIESSSTSIIVDVVTTLGPVKPQRLASGHASSAEASEVRDPIEIHELEIEHEMSALLPPPSSSSPAKSRSLIVGTPPHRLCLETSFTSLQSPTEFPQAGRELSVDSRGLPWEYVSIASDLITTPRPDDNKSFNHPLNWEYTQRIAPLATPETMSEASSNPPSPLPPIRPIRRTPKISGNLSTAADDLKSNLHFAMLAAKNYGLHEDPTGGSNSSSGNSEASYETSRSLKPGNQPPPPVPRRRDSVILQREHTICTAACCRDDLSENSTPSSVHSTRIIRSNIHRVHTDFPVNNEEIDTNGSSPDFYEVKNSTSQRDSSNNDVFLSIRSSPECKGLMAPATDLSGEWKKRLDTTSTATSVDASLPLLRGLSPTPGHVQHTSPFFNAKRKKYVYPITLVGRGESSV